MDISKNWDRTEYDYLLLNDSVAKGKDEKESDNVSENINEGEHNELYMFSESNHGTKWLLEDNSKIA